MSTIGSNIAALKSLHNLRLNEDGFGKSDRETVIRKKAQYRR